ncbi:MAG: SHOCT domain-containing protein [Candidatus Thermoplasmatota archaeon]|nr:SHOCT domain-containing protein [Candidatus Thermoplasmatota archaeon]
MARFSEGMIFNVPPPVLKKACRIAVGDLDLFELDTGRDHILSREKARFDTYNPVDIELLFEEGPYGIELRINGENEGVGPFQEHHVKAKVLDLLSRIQIDLDFLEDKAPLNDTGEMSSELRMLSDLYARGVITDIEFLRAKRRLLGDRM